jgi:hypothetical protein
MEIPGAGSTPPYTHTTAGLARRHGGGERLRPVRRAGGLSTPRPLVDRPEALADLAPATPGLLGARRAGGEHERTLAHLRIEPRRAGVS